MKTVELYTPKGYLDLNKEDKKKICNKCGPKSDFDLIPDHLLFLDIGEACCIHDFMWYVARPCNADKEEADRVFLYNMLRIVEAGTRKFLIKVKIFDRIFRIKNPIYLFRRNLAHKYYTCVSKFGGPFFWRTKNDSKNLMKVNI